METMIQAVGLGLLAGAAIPVGGLLACLEHIRPAWLENEIRHSVIAFGGGILLAAVALVLVPEGVRELSAPAGIACFLAGGVLFCAIDRSMARRGGPKGQLLAMLLDFVPESLALGAILASKSSVGLLLALLIALQNLPEAFNAYRELQAAGRPRPPSRLLGAFALIALLGPLAAWLGHALLREQPGPLAAIMLFAAGGILYLIFEDIAPRVPLANRWAPPLGAVGGFALGMLGQYLLA